MSIPQPPCGDLFKTRLNSLMLMTCKSSLNFENIDLHHIDQFTVILLPFAADVPCTW